MRGVQAGVGALAALSQPANVGKTMTLSFSTRSSIRTGSLSACIAAPTCHASGSATHSPSPLCPAWALSAPRVLSESLCSMGADNHPSARAPAQVCRASHRLRAFQRLRSYGASRVGADGTSSGWLSDDGAPRALAARPAALLMLHAQLLSSGCMPDHSALGWWRRHGMTWHACLIGEQSSL